MNIVTKKEREREREREPREREINSYGKNTIQKRENKLFSMKTWFACANIFSLVRDKLFTPCLCYELNA